MEAIALNIWTGIFALATIIVVYFWVKLTRFLGTGIPHNTPWPIVGSMAPVLFKRMHLNDIMRSYYEQWPEAKYVGFYNFHRPGVIIRDLELVKSLAVKNFESFANHKTFVDDRIDPIFGKSLFFLRDDKWRRIRHLLSPAFTTSKMRLMFDMISDCATSFTDGLLKGTQEFEAKDVFSRYTNDVIASCAFGLSVDSMNQRDNEFYILGRKTTNFSGPQIAKILFIDFFPNLARLLQVRVFDQAMMSYFRNVIQSTIDARVNQNIVRPDMLQLMIESRDNQLDLNIEDMTAQAFIFFFGGFETSSSLMSFAATALALNPDIQDKLYEEIRTVSKGVDGRPSYEAIQDMVYLDAVLCETLRLYSVTGFVDRVCNKEFELPPAVPGAKPFKITPGMFIWFPIIGIHMDPKYYTEPDKFDPNRFLDRKMQSQSCYLPFGLGPRACIGNRFALLENKVVLFHMLNKVKLVPSKKLKLPLRLDKRTFNVVVDGGFWLEFIPRENDE